MILHRLTFEQAAVYQAECNTDIARMIRNGAPAAAFRTERHLLSHLRLCDTWGFGVYACITADAGTVGVIAVGHNRRAKGEWGRYANVYVVHTRVRHRQHGHATAAYRLAADAARETGCSRLFTAAASYGGWRSQRALGWPAWGTNRAGEIVTDTDLTGDAPDGVPPRCRDLNGPGRPLTAAEHAALLTDPAGTYRIPPEALPAPYRETA